MTDDCSLNWQPHTTSKIKIVLAKLQLLAEYGFFSSIRPCGCAAEGSVTIPSGEAANQGSTVLI